MNESKATRYQRLRRRADAAALALSVSTLALIAVTPFGRWLYERGTALAAGAPAAVAAALAFVLFVALIVLLCEAVALPAVLYRAHHLDPAYGRAPAGLRAWLAGTLVGLAGALVAAVIVRASGAAAGGAWWLMAGVVTSAVLMTVIHGGPAILARLGAVRALNRPSLAARLAELSQRAGVPVASILEWDVDASSSTVAMVAGVGRGRRVLVAGDVARRWPDDEVAVIVAHEIAHHVHHDLWRALALNAIVLCAGFWAGDVAIGAAGSALGIAGVTDPVALPLVALACGGVWLSATPLRHAQSRRQERRADCFALDHTGHAEAFASAVRRAGARHMAEDRPSSITQWLYHRHPSISERLELAAGHRVGAAAGGERQAARQR